MSTTDYISSAQGDWHTGIPGIIEVVTRDGRAHLVTAASYGREGNAVGHMLSRCELAPDETVCLAKAMPCYMAPTLTITAAQGAVEAAEGALVRAQETLDTAQAALDAALDAYFPDHSRPRTLPGPN